MANSGTSFGGEQAKIHPTPKKWEGKRKNETGEGESPASLVFERSGI
jgi:hypothetical protein